MRERVSDILSSPPYIGIKVVSAAVFPPYNERGWRYLGPQELRTTPDSSALEGGLTQSYERRAVWDDLGRDTIGVEVFATSDQLPGVTVVSVTERLIAKLPEL